MLLAVAAATTAAAALAPLYLEPTTRTLLRAALHQATITDLGIRVSAPAQRGTAVDTLSAQARTTAPDRLAAELSGTAGRGPYPERVRGLRVPQTFPATGPGEPSAATVVVYRQSACAHLRIVRGRCATRTAEAVVSAGAARSAGWSIGTALPMSAGGNGHAPLRVVGTYEAKRPDDPYWLGVDLHPHDAIATEGLISVAPVFVTRGTLDHTWVAGRLTGAGGHAIGTAVVTAEPDACARLSFAAGNCPDRPDQVAVSAAAARRAGLGIGDTVDVPVSPSGYPVRVAGIYRPQDPHDPLWSAPGMQAAPTSQPAALPALGAVFASERTLSEAALPVRSTLDMPLRRSAVTTAGTAAVTAMADRVAALSPAHTSVQTRVGAVLDRFEHDRQTLQALVLLVGAQLTVLAWFVLYLIAAGSIEARGSEIALAKVRGLRSARVVAFAVSEPVLLLVAAAPLGVALAWLVVLALTGSVAPLNLLTVAAAAIAAAGGLCAVVLASRRVLSRSVLEQWRRAGADPVGGRAFTPADGVVVALAAAGIYELQANATLQGGRLATIALLGPALVAIAVATLGVRLLPLACRLAVRRSRGSARIGGYVAVRQVARRPAGLRLVALLAVAVSLAFFTVDATTAATHDRTRRAQIEVGSDRVLTVSPNGHDLVRVVRHLDPGGRSAMAAAVLPAAPGQGTALLAVDTRRLPAVAPWSESYGGPALSEVATRLRPRLPTPARLSGRQLRVRVHVASDNRPGTPPAAATALPTLRLGLRSDLGRTRTVELGRLRFGEHFYGTTLSACGAGCRLASVTVVPHAHKSGRLSVLLEGAEQRSGNASWRQVGAGFGDSSLWATTGGGVGVGYVTDAGGFTLFLPPAVHGLVTVARQDQPAALPVVVTERATAQGAAGSTVTNLDLGTVPADPIATATVLPQVGDRAVLADLPTAQTLITRPAQAALATYEVWLSPSAPPNFAHKLAAAGVHVLGSRTIAGRVAELRQQGPALALRLFLLAALAAVVLAAASTATATYLSARRRAYELATLRAVAFERAVLLRAAVGEQLLLLGAGLVIGVGAGVAAVGLSLRRVPFYSDRPPLPVHWTPDLPALAALVAVIAVLSCAAAAASAVLLVRTASPDRLREATP